MPPQWRDWLGYEPSLSERLRALSGGHLRVDVLRQFVGQPDASERAALGMGTRHWALIREVLLSGASTQPWVYARSILPLTTLTGHRRSLRYLQDRPLGSVLFTDKSMVRRPIEAAQVPTHYLPGRLNLDDGTLWGRRSVFVLGAQNPRPLLVAEFFLPGFDPSRR
jgi:chorismate--pyruvate lyase